MTPPPTFRKLNDEEMVDYFAGHFTPAVFLLTTGTWWAYNELLAHVRSQNGQGNGYRSRVWYAGPCSRRMPWESLLRLLLMAAGGLSQIYSCCYVEQLDVHPERLQHVALFLAFALSGAVDVVTAVGGRRRPLPRGADRAAAILSYIILALVFAAHAVNGGRSMLEHHLHQYYVYISGAMVLVHMAEAATDARLLALALTRVYLQLLLGAHSLQIGFTLFMPAALTKWWNHPWAVAENNSIAMASFVMCGHMMLTFVFLMVLGGLIKRCHSTQVKDELDVEKKMPLLLKGNGRIV